MIVLVILCPPSLLSIATDTEVGANSYYLLWTAIALMDAGLYATLRALLIRGLERPDSTAQVNHAAGTDPSRTPSINPHATLRRAFLPY